MPRRRSWLLIAGLTALGATRASGAEPDPAAPSVPPPPAAIPAPPPPPPPGSTSTTPPRQKRRFLALPYLGVHSYQNWARGFYGPGLRVGALIGGRLNDEISLNAELTFDVANVDATLGDISESTGSFALAPLWGLPTGPLEIVFGPKAGLFFTKATTGVTTGSESWGWILGVNAGLFMPVSPATSIGVLLGYELRKTLRICGQQSGTEMCLSGTGEGVARLLGLTAAALF